jgi:hypothetical protein
MILSPLETLMQYEATVYHYRVKFNRECAVVARAKRKSAGNFFSDVEDCARQRDSGASLLRHSSKFV